MPRIDPADVAGINARAREWGAPRSVDIERIFVGDDAIDMLVDEVRIRSAGGRVLLLEDDTLIERAGEQLKPFLESALAGHVPLSRERLDSPCADTVTARRVGEALVNFGAIVAVGSGTVTDIAKAARHDCERRTGHRAAFISFPTAASMTAYTSALTVLSVDGVKRTLPASPPDAVICDLRTLSSAPAALTQAGFGDVLARSVAGGDWLLAHELGMDDCYSAVPDRLLVEAEAGMLAQAEGIPKGDPEAVRAVTEAVLLAGMAMSVVDQTAPLSGWEHVISHFLDLAAVHEGRPVALHGAQVGLGTLIAARAYAQAWRRLDVDRLVDVVPEDDTRLDRVFAGFDSDGRLIGEIRRDYERKKANWSNVSGARRDFVDRFHRREFDGFVGRHVRSPEAVESALRRAGAAVRFADLPVKIPRETIIAAVEFGHLIRARFTLGDLLDRTGWLTRSRVEMLIEDL